MAYEELPEHQRKYILALEGVAHGARLLLDELEDADPEDLQAVLDEHAESLRREIDAAIPPKPGTEGR